MLNKRNQKRSLIIGLVCLIPLAGCGGGANSADSGTTASPFLSNSTNSAVQNGGRMQVVIDWSNAFDSAPAASRYLPPYAQSLFFEFYPVGNPGQRYSFAANRPGDGSTTQTTTYPALLPVGTYQVACVARTQALGQGATVASTTAQFVVTLNQTANVPLTLASTIKQINILKQPLITKTGVALALPISATDPDGKVILLPANALKYSLVSGANLGSVDTNGNFIGTADGTARVRVAEPGAGVSAETDIRVANGAFFQILNQPLVVKAGSASGTTLQLQAATLAAGGAANPFPAGSLVWSVISGNSFGTITPAGLFTGTGDGVARVQVTQPDSGLTAEADVTVQGYGTGVNVGVQ